VRLKRSFPASLSRRLSYRAGNAFKQIDSEIHFEPGEAHLIFPDFGPLSILLWIFRLCSVRVNPDLVPPPASQHLINRHAIHFARDIPQRHFDRADAAPLTGIAAELLDLLED